MKARPLNYRDMRLMGYRIAILRTKSNLTQVVFGKKYGVNRFAVIRWEHGVHVPK